MDINKMMFTHNRLIMDLERGWDGYIDCDNGCIGSHGNISERNKYNIGFSYCVKMAASKVEETEG